MNFVDNILKNTSGIQTHKQEKDKRVKMYVDFIIKFCIDEEFSDSDHFAIPLKDKEYASEEYHNKACIGVQQPKFYCHFVPSHQLLHDTLPAPTQSTHQHK